MALAWSDTLGDNEWEELSALYKVAPLGDKPAASLQIVYGNSRYRCFVREHGRIVGVGRALADGIDCAYICDVAVLPAYQGTGLGKQIVAHLLDLARGHKKIILYAVPGKEAFYRKFGFARMRTAMAIFEDQALARGRGYLDDADA
jgi:GNAT superfamily N-acetyltransferase